MMLWIDWLYLDWQVISAWIFGILIAFYIAIRLKNYFFRWSASPPKFLQPFIIHLESTFQGGVKQTKIMVEGEGDKLDPVVIWVVGKCPRFLRNIAYSLTLHVKSICVNEVKSHTNSLRQLEIDKATTNQVYYRRAGQIGNDFEESPQNKIKILLDPPIQKDWKYNRGVKICIILGRRIKQEEVQTLEREGVIIINLRGGHLFRGWELALVGELIAIFTKNQGTAK